MAENKKVCDFAYRWWRIFGDSETTDRDLSDNFEKECRGLDFQMDCGEKFRTKYGEKAFYDSTALDSVIGNVSDEMLLGSAVYSKWRYITHWTQQSLLDSENRKWFTMALDRLRVISDRGWINVWRSQAQVAPPAVQKLMLGTIERFLALHPEDDPKTKQG